MKVVLLTESMIQPPFIEGMLNDLVQIPDLQILACILHTPTPTPLLQKLRHHWNKGHKSYIPVLISQTLYRKIQNRLFPGKKTYFHLENWLKRNKVPVLRTDDLQSPFLFEKLKMLNAEAALLAGYHLIIKKAFIEAFPKGVLSYHYGDLRKYRGQPAGFWELFYGEKEFTVTVQKIRTGIDNGIPVAEQRFEIGPYTTLHALDKIVEQTSYTLMSVAVKRIMSPDYKDEIPEKYGKLYTLPNLWQWIIFQAKMTLRKLRGKFIGKL